MNEPEVEITLDGEGETYQPAQSLTGRFQILTQDFAEVQAVELSVLWYTEGAGDEDLVVHHFQRWSPDDSNAPDLRQSMHFGTRLPRSPLSYEGVIVKIRWCVRVRVFLPRGKELFAEHGFRVGQVPAPQWVAG